MSSMLLLELRQPPIATIALSEPVGFWLALQWYWQYCGAALPMLKKLACALDVPMAELLR
jgi:hypothetical protein